MEKINGVEAVVAQPPALNRAFEGASPSDPTKFELYAGIGYNPGMENAETRIVQRYFRKTVAHPEGAVCHHGDCDFFSISICSCGLLHDLMPLSPELIEDHYPQFNEEMVHYEQAREAIMHRPRHAKKH